MHKLLSQQIKHVSGQESLNYDKLLEMISLTYSEIDEAKESAERAHATLEQQVVNLNKKIAEAKEISELLNSIGQIIFTFNQDLSINPHYSSKAGEYFNFKHKEIPSLVETFKLKPEQIESFQTWVNNLYQPSTLRRWNKIVQISPFRELRLEEGSEVIILELDYKPIIHDGKLSCILVVGNDVTRSRRIAAELSKQKQLQLRHSEHVDAFFSNSQRILQLFLKDLSELNHRIIEAKDVSGSEENKNLKIYSVKSLYSAVHTVKGSAGTYGFNYLAAICHRVEDTIDNYLNKKTTQLFNKHFDALIDELFTIKRFWNQLCQYNASDERIRISKQKYYKLIDKVRELSLNDPEYAWITDELEELEAIEEIEFSGKYHRMLNQIKETQDLYMESLEIEIPKGRIKRQLAEALDPILIHLVKNAIAHGIEGKKEREKKSKGPGRIHIRISESTSEHLISVKDNGRGIDPEQIANKAMEKGIISAEQCQTLSSEQKINLIFLPQLSTKKSVSYSSGRGIGMYSVKYNLDKLGGDISVKSNIDEGTEFSFSIPKASLSRK